MAKAYFESFSMTEIGEESEYLSPHGDRKFQNDN
jgi:hypothetical protein